MVSFANTSTLTFYPIECVWDTSTFLEVVPFLNIFSRTNHQCAQTINSLALFPSRSKQVQSSENVKCLEMEFFLFVDIFLVIIKPRALPFCVVAMEKDTPPPPPPPPHTHTHTHTHSQYVNNSFSLEKRKVCYWPYAIYLAIDWCLDSASVLVNVFLGKSFEMDFIFSSRKKKKLR